MTRCEEDLEGIWKERPNSSDVIFSCLPFFATLQDLSWNYTFTESQAFDDTTEAQDLYSSLIG